MKNLPIKTEVSLKENFPHADFQLRNITPATIIEIINTLEKEFIVHKKHSIYSDEEILEGALIFSKEKELLAAIYIDHEPSLFHTNFIKLTLMYVPTTEGIKILELLKTKLNKYILPRFHISLRILGRWKELTEYALTPEEFNNHLIPELFYGIDASKLAESFLKSPQNILIIFGKPGTGKSKLIQYIIGQSPFILQKAVNVLVIKGEKNIKDSADNMAIYLENDIVVLDDLDLLSLKRKGNDEISDVISTILSVTDGFIPKKVKIIISTNKTFKEIDPALLRPSRLFDILELKDIPKDYYLKLCKIYPELIDGIKLFEDKEHIKVSEILDFITRIKSHKAYLRDRKISKRTQDYDYNIGFSL